jgi:collagenase-like PrtC family protease
VQYHWPRARLQDFYAAIAESPVAVVYLGETVCSKRHAMRLDDWLELATLLAAHGKEVCLSTLALIEAESELKTLRRLCANGRYRVEANDIGAVHLLASAGIPFVSGPSINIYNQRTLQLLAAQGLQRWVMPSELSGATLAEILAGSDPALETEVTVYGRIPLAWSARCFTARHHNLPKDDCREICGEYPDGLLVETREAQAFLAFNGIQTQSAQTYALAAELDDMARLGVSLARIYPQQEGTLEVIRLLDGLLSGRLPLSEVNVKLHAMMPVGPCDGYWHGRPGIAAGC